MLSAIAKGTIRVPRLGFYSLTQDLGLLTGDDPESQKTFWEKAKADIYSTR